MAKRIRKKVKKASRPKVSRPKKKKVAKKRISARITKKKKSMPDITEKMVLIGEITHYFPHVKAGVINLREGELLVGDTIFIKGHTTKFKQKVASLQINRVDVDKIKKGDDAGIAVKSRVRIGDSVYKV